jgi:hypothetical protein
MLFLLLETALAGAIYDQSQTAPAIVWAGVDYSKARFFVPETFDNAEVITFFNPGGGLRDAVRRYGKPADAWNDLIKEWNAMLQYDLVEDMEKAILRDLVVDLPNEAGQTTGKKEPYFESQYESKNNPMTLDMTAIGDMVKKYKLKSKEGLALVFIYERASYVDEQACLWPTWFDTKTKVVIQTARTCEKPGGQGFRNYWYTPMLNIGKDILKALKKHEI